MGCTMVRYIYARSVVIEKSGYVSLWSPGITLCLFWAPFHSHNYRQLNFLLDSKGIYLETLVWILKLRWDFFKKKKKKPVTSMIQMERLFLFIYSILILGHHFCSMITC